MKIGLNCGKKNMELDRKSFFRSREKIICMELENIALIRMGVKMVGGKIWKMVERKRRMLEIERKI
jgi:hypothetical protein